MPLYVPSLAFATVIVSSTVNPCAPSDFVKVAVVLSVAPVISILLKLLSAVVTKFPVFIKKSPALAKELTLACHTFVKLSDEYNKGLLTTATQVLLGAESVPVVDSIVTNPYA
mgnify:CR=1 FL=1